MRSVLKGGSAARGMALGRARLEQPGRILVDDRPLAAEEIEPEVERLLAAIGLARDELRTLRDKLHGTLASDVGDFLEAHGLILADRDLVAGLVDLVRLGRYRASAALKLQRDKLVAVFEAMEDAYLRSRKEDIDHVLGRVQAALVRESSVEERKLASRVGEILVSDILAPAELVPLAENGMLGAVLTNGSTLSHSAILARSLRLPMVVGVDDALGSIADGDLILVDGEHGEVVVHPNAQDIARYRHWQREQVQIGKRLARLREAQTLTRDGVPIRLYANAERPADVARARLSGAAGIGLYRTEFLFLQRREIPGEEEQFLAYRDLVLGMGGLPVTIRTLDLGADKADASGVALEEEPNPALGVRGVRLALRHPQLMITQLRAIVRASSYGPVRILVPMITLVEEIHSVRRMLDQCVRDLRSTGQDIAGQVELGAMIEVPAAAIALGGLIRYVDFISIGTNDLVQYVLAADRANDHLGTLYDPLHPAVIKLLAQILAIARRARRPVSLCGEMAADTRYTALLLALGLEDFSMHPGALLEVRDRIAQLDHAALLRHAPALLRASSGARIAGVLDRMQA